eukprot:UN06110
MISQFNCLQRTAATKSHNVRKFATYNPITFRMKSGTSEHIRQLVGPILLGYPARVTYNTEEPLAGRVTTRHLAIHVWRGGRVWKICYLNKLGDDR